MSVRLKCTASEYAGFVQQQLATALTKQTLKAGFCPCKFTLAQHILSKYTGFIFVTDFLLKQAGCGLVLDNVVTNESDPIYNCDDYVIRFHHVRDVLNITEDRLCCSDYDNFFNCLVNYAESVFANTIDYIHFVTKYGISLPITVIIAILNNYIVGNMLLDIRKNLEECLEDPCKCFELITDYTENFLLTLTGIRLMCERIHLTVNEDIIQHLKVAAERLGYDIEELLEKYRCRQYCTTHRRLTGEKLILYVVPELMHNGYLTLLLELIIACHENPHDIDLIVDYRFAKDYKWTESSYNRLQLAKQNFRSIVFVNYDHVDFGEYYEEVKPYLKADYDPISLFDMDIDRRMLEALTLAKNQIKARHINSINKCSGCQHVETCNVANS